MKSNNVKLGPFLNKKILEHGRKNIPHHILVKAVKEKDVVKAEFAGAKDLKFLEFEKKEEKKKGLLEKVTGSLEKETKKEEKPKEDIKEEKTEKEKVLEKEPEKVEKKIEEKKIPKLEKIDKGYEVKKKEFQRYGRVDKKPKVKERAKKIDYG